VEVQPLLLTFEVAAFATVLAAIVGVALAALMTNVRFPGRDLLDVAIASPIVLPPTVLGLYLLVMIGRESPIGHAYKWLTGDQFAFTKGAAVVAAAVGSLPLVVKTVRTSFEQTDRSLVLAARTLGASPLRAFLTIQLPLASRGILAGSMLAFARSTGDFGATLMVGGDIPGVTRTAAIAIYDLYQEHRERDAMLMVLALTSIVGVLLYVVGRLTAHRVP
jgi:molybdate transport system permease protein